MARKVFYSFHYKPDNSRASQVRNMGVIEGNAPVLDNDWESITSRGDKAIQNWIDGQLLGKSCTIVLIGTNTAGRKWINYEIVTTWNDGKGLLGIYIHNLKDFQSNQSARGRNPFDEIRVKERLLSSMVHAYDPPYRTSTDVYAYIKQNLESWVETAVYIRSMH
ncbi:MAG: TIR domain-containing protein [Acidobacteria bacterium]|nr:TIR domain-containing protein [Acidobacteriota bacterium]